MLSALLGPEPGPRSAYRDGWEPGARYWFSGLMKSTLLYKPPPPAPGSAYIGSSPSPSPSAAVYVVLGAISGWPGS